MKNLLLLLIVGAVIAGNSVLHAQNLVVYKNNSNLYGYVIENTNDVVISPKYDCALHFTSSGLALVKKDLKWGYINKSGKEVIPIKYDHAESFSNGRAVVVLNKLFGYIDTMGKAVIPIVYDAAYTFSNGFAAVRKGNLHAYINKSGKEITAYKYDRAKRFGEDDVGFIRQDVINLAAVAIVDKTTGLCRWGCINTEGKEVIGLKYINQPRFCHGLAAVTLEVGQNTACTYVNTWGKETEGKYTECNELKDGLAKVSVSIPGSAYLKYGYIDSTGKEIIPAVYDHAGHPFEGFIKMGKSVSKESKFSSTTPKMVYGFYDVTGKQIMPVEHENVDYSPSDGGFFMVTVFSKRGIPAIKYFDRNGNLKENYKPTAGGR